MLGKEEFIRVCLDREPLIESIIENVVTDNKRFTKALIDHYSYLCSRCGNCCETEECRYLCDRNCYVYSKRPKECKDYPRWDIGEGQYGLNHDYECNYAINMVIIECIKELGGMRV